MDLKIAGDEDAADVVEAVNRLIIELGGDSLDTNQSENAASHIIGNPELGFIMIARDKGTLVGLATVSYQSAIRTLGRYAIVQEMFVAPDHRDSGLGGRLLERAIQVASENGCRVVELGTPPNGERQESFYRRHGFTDVGMRLRWTGHA